MSKAQTKPLKNLRKISGVAARNAATISGVAKHVLRPFLLVGLLALPALAGTHVIDGDTIVIDKEHIRILNIDTPEIRHAKCFSERQRGLAAKARTEVLVRSGTISLVRGDKGGMIDRYGRSLARVLINGRDLGQILIAEGLARRWDGARHPWCGL